MEPSILNTIKQMLGLGIEESPFDQELITHINTALILLTEIGVGKEGFFLADSSAVWSDFLNENGFYNPAKQYIGLQVRLIWDPPSSSAVVTSYQEQLKKLEFYLQDIARARNAVASDPEPLPDISPIPKDKIVLYDEYF